MEAGYVPIGNMHAYACKRSERVPIWTTNCGTSWKGHKCALQNFGSWIGIFFLPLNTKHVNFSQLASALWASFFHAPFRMHWWMNYSMNVIYSLDYTDRAIIQALPTKWFSIFRRYLRNRYSCIAEYIKGQVYSVSFLKNQWSYILPPSHNIYTSRVQNLS